MVLRIPIFIYLLQVVALSSEENCLQSSYHTTLNSDPYLDIFPFPTCHLLHGYHEDFVSFLWGLFCFLLCLSIRSGISTENVWDQRRHYSVVIRSQQSLSVTGSQFNLQNTAICSAHSLRTLSCYSLDGPRQTHGMRTLGTLQLLLFSFQFGHSKDGGSGQ